MMTHEIAADSLKFDALLYGMTSYELRWRDHDKDIQPGDLVRFMLGGRMIQRTVRRTARIGRKSIHLLLEGVHDKRRVPKGT